MKLSELTKWDHRFLNLAAHVSGWSKDPSTKCGAVITRGNRIISLGFNGFPTGVKDSSFRLNDRTTKYQLVLHAETNALLFAKGDLVGCAIYTWPFPPCCRCAVNIIQSDITRVVAPFPSDDLEERWREDLEMAKVLYSESGIQFDEVELDITSIPQGNYILPVGYTKDEGATIFPWEWEAINIDNIAMEARTKKLHSIHFKDEGRWDCVNSWTAPIR